MRMIGGDIQSDPNTGSGNLALTCQGALPDTSGDVVSVVRTDANKCQRRCHRVLRVSNRHHEANPERVRELRHQSHVRMQRKRLGKHVKVGRLRPRGEKNNCHARKTPQGAQ
jgi:hypothetical protein